MCCIVLEEHQALKRERLIYVRDGNTRRVKYLYRGYPDSFYSPIGGSMGEGGAKGSWPSLPPSRYQNT